jgi:hypothetical protein
MAKAKEYVCGYSGCLHNGEKIPSEEAIKDGTRYYHKDCHEEKCFKTQIFDIYYKYYRSTEDFHMVRKAINGFVSNSNAEYVLYVLCQAIHKKTPFKGIFTLGWLVKNDMEIKKKYQAMKNQIKRKEIEKNMNNDIKPVSRERTFKFSSTCNPGFGQILGGDDNRDQ